jgi:hypothetical protein
MGLLSGLMSPPITVLEKRLEKIYTQVYRLMGMSASEARSIFQQEFEWAKMEAARGGDLVVPDGFGNYLLANRQSDPKIGAFIARIAQEGVRDKDVLWFWNMHNVERILMMRTFDWCVGANVQANLRQGMTQQEAEAHSRKIHPLYGNPDDTSVAHGDDRPIPVELKDRIDIYIERRSKEKGDRYESDMLGASSFNALIRRELRVGRI